MPPLLGQGDPLPDDFPYKGQWMLRGRMFLYMAPAQSVGGPEASPAFHWQGKACFGLNVMQLAALFRMNVETIFEHNRAKSLLLVTTEDVPGQMPGKRYVFQIGEKQETITLTAWSTTGNA